MAARTKLAISLLVLGSTALFMTPREVFALIQGGVGNAPLNDPGWPKGAAAIFNSKSRVAYWEGPPFGGGQWYAECRGDAKAISAVLADFAKLDVKLKRVVLHDGVGHSFWLNPNREPGKNDAAKIDWIFMVWQKGNWERLRKLPADLNPTDAADAADGPPSQLDIYTGGNIKWADVVVPKGLKVVDNRLEAHGFSAEDGVVLEGKVTDQVTKKPVVAKVWLQRVEPQKKGGYEYPNVAVEATDDEGRWVLKKVPAGWHRVVVGADRFVPRVVGYVKTEGEPRWHGYETGLARAGVVAGRVVDDAGKPLADVDVRISDVVASPGGRYESPVGYSVRTGKDGRFRSDQVPVGSASIWVYKTGYVRPGLGPKFTTPKEDIELSMVKASRITVTVDFTGKARPAGYMVSIEPEGGEAIGKYGGSGNINDKNQMTFDNVPPGKYVLRGRPNPGADKQETEPVKVELKGGDTSEVRLEAK